MLLRSSTWSRGTLGHGLLSTVATRDEKAAGERNITMAFGMPFPLSVAPVLIVVLALSLAALFTRVWRNDSRVRARRELELLGFQPGRAYKLGGAWTLRAVR